MGGGVQDRLYSEDTAKAIDEEISRIIRRGYSRAKEILNEQRESLEKTVAVLFEKEVMDGDELRALLKSAGVGLKKGYVNADVEDDSSKSSINGSENEKRSETENEGTKNGKVSRDDSDKGSPNPSTE